jgi:hypothetical protein
MGCSVTVVRVESRNQQTKKKIDYARGRGAEQQQVLLRGGGGDGGINDCARRDK